MPRPQTPPTEGQFCPYCSSENMRFDRKREGGGKTRYKCMTCKKTTTKRLSSPPQILPKFSKAKSSRYIVTSAVNDTPVNAAYLATLKAMAAKLDARLIIIATCYENPDATSQKGKLESYSWPVETLPYICQERFQINKNLVIHGDWRIKHTAINPLQGMNHCGGMQSEIYGHAQLGMEIIPTPKDSVPKMISTTGTVSQLNFGGSPTAKKAQFHHSYNALFIEVRGNKFWLTQLPWDGEGVQLYDRYYTPTSSRKAPKLAGVVYGDTHWDQQSPVEKANTMALHRGLKAKRNMVCDVLDFHTGSHHREGRVIENLRNPDFDIRSELDRAVEYLKSVPNCVVVASNHNDHLDQWFNRFDPRRMDANLPLYADLMELVRKYDCGLFAAYCKESGVTADFTDRNKEYDVAGVDCSQHADIGPNGSRGSIKAFAKTGRKTMMGHPHTPMIHKGSWGVGTSAMGMDYARGYSSWMVAHGLISAKGKRSMIFLVDGEMSPMLKSAIKNSNFS